MTKHIAGNRNPASAFKINNQSGGVSWRTGVKAALDNLACERLTVAE
jgi:hypothetical protein